MRFTLALIGLTFLTNISWASNLNDKISRQVSQISKQCERYALEKNGWLDLYTQSSLVKGCLIQKRIEINEKRILQLYKILEEGILLEDNVFTFTQDRVSIIRNTIQELQSLEGSFMGTQSLSKLKGSLASELRSLYLKENYSQSLR